MLRRLSDTYDCTALDWWGGGWTSRSEIYALSKAQPTPPKPFPFIAEHIQNFVQQQLGPEKIVLVGASLGGAVALDVANRCQDTVEALVLIDAGGESYASPSPDLVTAAAPLASGVQRLINIAADLDPTYSKEGRLLGLHRTQPLWIETGGEYLRSGSYERVVNPELIRRTPQRTMVLWGRNDKVLNPKDLDKFERDLPRCEAVHLVDGAAHSPQLDQPAVVEGHMRDFLKTV